MTFFALEIILQINFSLESSYIKILEMRTKKFQCTTWLSIAIMLPKVVPGKIPFFVLKPLGILPFSKVENWFSNDTFDTGVKKVGEIFKIDPGLFLLKILVQEISTDLLMIFILPAKSWVERSFNIFI